jgi:hypothetical protein
MFTGQMSTIVGEQLISTRSRCIKRNKEKKTFFDFRILFTKHVYISCFKYRKWICLSQVTGKKIIRNGKANIIFWTIGATRLLIVCTSKKKLNKKC